MARYTNTAIGEVYEFSFDVSENESVREIAWGRALRAVCVIKGWNIHDVKVSV